MKSDLKTKILAVDDAEGFRDMYGELLQGSPRLLELYDLKTAASASEAWKIFYEYKPDIVILDVNLPGSSGLDICRQIRQKTRHQNYIGIIFVTADNTPTVMVQGLELGADDFCTKSQTATELLARIKSVVRIKKMADSLKASNEKLKAANERLAKITITDELTKLYNMRYFKKRLNQEFIRAQRYDKFLSILMFDLDHFKLVNDNYDHLMGSFVLAEIGQLVAKSIRSVDIGARFGGDEYVVMLPETGGDGARAMAERIGRSIAETVFDNGVYQLRLTASIGVSTMGPGSGETFKNAIDLIRSADRYLYEAKERGRGGVVDRVNSVQSVQLATQPDASHKKKIAS